MKPALPCDWKVNHTSSQPINKPPIDNRSDPKVLAKPRSYLQELPAEVFSTIGIDPKVPNSAGFQEYQFPEYPGNVT
jgi:hypothetical protein